MKNTMKLSVSVVLMFLALALSTSHAQQPPASRVLTLAPPTGLPIIPAMEGWYENEDGTVTISFGYHNKNLEGTIVIPFGENNRIEPARFDGIQPTFFDKGRHTGVFTVTLPESMRGESVWWFTETGENSMYKVPGRATAEGYQLDRRPRPQGSVTPIVWFNEDGPRSSGPGWRCDGPGHPCSDRHTGGIDGPCDGPFGKGSKRSAVQGADPPTGQLGGPPRTRSSSIRQARIDRNPRTE